MYIYRMNQDHYLILRTCTYNLVKTVLNALTGTSESQCKILLLIISHVLFVILGKIKSQHDGEVCLEDLDEHDKPGTVLKLVGRWIQTRVVGHVKFSGVQFKKFREEVQVSYFYYDFIQCLFLICRYGKCLHVRS